MHWCGYMYLKTMRLLIEQKKYKGSKNIRMKEQGRKTNRDDNAYLFQTYIEWKMEQKDRNKDIGMMRTK